MEYEGEQIPKIDGSTSIYDAFRDKGELTSNLPVNVAEKIVTYDETEQSEESVNASDMLKEIRDLGAMAAEFEVTFAAREHQKELTIDVLDDDLSEYDESIVVALLDSEGQMYEEGQIMATIINDDEEPSVHVAFHCEETITIKDDTEKAQIAFKRTGNLATGTNAVLNYNGEPMGYVDFAPYQDTQIVLAVEGTYTLTSEGAYTVSEDTVVVQMEEQELPKGADPVLDAVPDEYDELPAVREESPSNWGPDWSKNVGTVEDKKSIIVMGSSGECLFERDDSSTDGTFSFDSAKNEGVLDTGGGEDEGIVYARSKKAYDLTGIESVEGSMYVKDMDVGYGDVIFGVWNTGHDKIYTSSNKSRQDLKYTLPDNYQGSRYIYYADKDLHGIWDQGWTGYIPNGFKMNKRTYKIQLENAEPLNFTKGSYAPTVTGDNTMYYTIGSDRKINFSYTTDSGYPVELVGFQFKNNKNQYSSVYSLNGQGSLTFDQSFLKSYEGNWCYDDADGYNAFTIRPVFAKIGVYYEINQTDAGTITIESPADKNLYKGDTVVFTGEGKEGATFAGVAYQCRKSAGSEILDYGAVGAVGGKVSINIDTAKYGHYTFEGVFDAAADQLMVNYANEDSKQNGKLYTEGLVIEKDVYDISNYYPLMADANDEYVTEWNVNGKKLYGDTFNYQLTGLPSDNTIKVDFVKESTLSMTKGTISGYLTRTNENLLNGVSSDIVLADTDYVVTTSHGTFTGKTDATGYFEIKDFYGVKGGMYSIAANYQNRTGYINFVYNGTEKQTLRFPQYPAGGFYPLEVIATVDGIGYSSNYIYLTSAGRVELMADIYVHSDEYEITNVTFHFLFNQKENYGDKLKEYEAVYDPDTNLGGKRQAWRLELNDTTALPKDSHMYVTVTANYPYTYLENGVTKTDYTSFTTDMADTGYNLAEPLTEDVTMIQQEIPEVPGLQNSEDDTTLLDIPVIGTLDMSVTSSTGGYFVQKGSWKEDGDIYTLVCGHTTRTTFGVGTLKDRYKGAVETKDNLAKAASDDPDGIAELKQKQATSVQIYPVFYMKFTIQTQAEPTAEDPDNLEHYVIGYELALGIDAFIRKNVPFMAGPVPVYIFVAINSEAYLQLQSAMPAVPLGEDISRYYLDEAETNVFFNAPVMEFGLKGGMGWNFWASVFAEGYIRVPFIVEFTPFDAATEISFDIGIGVEMIGFQIELEYDSNPYTFGNTELLEELKTIADQGSDTDPVAPASYGLSNGQKYETIDEALQNATFTPIERPKQEKSILRAGTMTNQKLTEGVFMNTDVQLIELENGNIMAFFLTDNQAEESYNYLSAAYAISKDNGKTWSEVEFVNENVSEETPSYQYDVKVFELDDRVMVTWSEADIDEILKGVDKENISAAKIRDVMAAMNLKGRFFDKETGDAIDDAMLIAGNTTVFCGGLEAVQNGDNIYVYYQRNVFPEGDDITAEELLANERTIALASANINNPEEWTSETVRVTKNEDEYRIVDVVPFTNSEVLGEILVLDRNGKIAVYDESTQSMKPDIEDWQLYLRTYEFDEEGEPVVSSLRALTDEGTCAKNPEVLTYKDQLYLFWNQEGNIVYTTDFTDAENTDTGAATIASDETLYVGTEFAASISEDGNILLSWVASDEEDGTLVPTDEIYGLMVEAGEEGLRAKGSPVALTDGDRPIGALDSISMNANESNKFLLAYSQLDEMLRRNNTSADILTQVNEEKAELEVEVDAPEYPLPGNIITANVTIRNEGLEGLNGYELTVSGIGESITLTNEVLEEVEDGKDNNGILAGREITVPVEIKIPKDFDETTMLKVEVSGLGSQAKYTASAEKEVFYDSYMVPLDIPEVESIPNSKDCLIRVSVRNEGNASGKVDMELMNQVYGSTDKEDVREYRYVSEEEITPGAEAAITYVMKDTLMDADVYSVIKAGTGEGYDQGTEAPMPKPVTVEAEDVSVENGGEEKPDTPGIPENPDDSEDLEKPENPDDSENPFKCIVKIVKNMVTKFVNMWKNILRCFRKPGR